MPKQSHVVQGYGVVRELENAATEEDDKPTHECLIKDCGQLSSDSDLTTPSQVPLHAIS